MVKVGKSQTSQKLKRKAFPREETIELKDPEKKRTVKCSHGITRSSYFQEIHTI